MKSKRITVFASEKYLPCYIKFAQFGKISSPIINMSWIYAILILAYDVK